MVSFLSDIIDKFKSKYKIKTKLGYYKIEVTLKEYQAIKQLYGPLNKFDKVLRDFIDLYGKLEKTRGDTVNYYYPFLKMIGRPEKNAQKFVGGLFKIVDEFRSELLTLIKRLDLEIEKINQIIKDIKSLTDQKNTELIHKLEFEIKIAKDREKEALKLINQIKQDPRLN